MGSGSCRIRTAAVKSAEGTDTSSFFADSMVSIETGHRDWAAISHDVAARTHNKVLHAWVPRIECRSTHKGELAPLPRAMLDIARALERRQALPDSSAVGLVDDTRIADHQHAAIRLGSNQPSCALL
jgi:hypothetical protein